MNKFVLASLLTAIGAMTTLSVQAHHSFAMFDHTKNIDIKGVVKEFQWTNPHTWIQLDVTNEKGKIAEWAIEGGSPNILRRQGWKSGTLKSGDKVTVTLHPLRNGAAGGALVSIKLEDGTVLTPATTSVSPPAK